MYRFTFFIIKIIAFFSLYIFPYRVMYGAQNEAYKFR